MVGLVLGAVAAVEEARVVVALRITVAVAERAPVARGGADRVVGAAAPRRASGTGVSEIACA